MASSRYGLSDEEFYDHNGYGWDYVMVFQVFDETAKVTLLVTPGGGGGANPMAAQPVPKQRMHVPGHSLPKSQFNVQTFEEACECSQ